MFLLRFEDRHCSGVSGDKAEEAMSSLKLRSGSNIICNDTIGVSNFGLG